MNPEEANCKEQSDKKKKNFIWTPSEDDYFLDFMGEEVKAKRKAGATFTTIASRIMVKAIKAKYCEEVEKEKLRK
ncbi:hypothetical protein AMTRI_Chr02g221280 [Amborella trichopoda]